MISLDHLERMFVRQNYFLVDEKNLHLELELQFRQSGPAAERYKTTTHDEISFDAQAAQEFIYSSQSFIQDSNAI